MKIIINEIQDKRIRRIYIFLKEFMDDLSPEDICKYWTWKEKPDFVSQAMGKLVAIFVTKYPEMEWWDAFDILTSSGFYEDLEQFFRDAIQNCDKLES